MGSVIREQNEKTGNFEKLPIKIRRVISSGLFVCGRVQWARRLPSKDSAHYPVEPALKANDRHGKGLP